MKMQVILRCLACRSVSFSRHGTGSSDTDILECNGCGTRRPFRELAEAAAKEAAGRYAAE